MKDKIIKHISIWESRCYQDGIPDEVPSRLEQLNKAPSYKAIVKCILKNDFNLVHLGYDLKKTQAYHEIKRNELSARGHSIQLKLNL